MDIWTHIKYDIICVYCTQQQFADSHILSLAAMTVTSEIPRLVSNLRCVTNFRDLVLWKCSYGPWDHFMFSVKKWIRPAF